MLITGQNTAEQQAGKHRAAQRALVGWRLHRVSGRRRAGVPAAPDEREAELLDERAHKFHTYGVTR